ncbi:MAG TPA: hypothetical protein VGL94_15360 [Ktedonobacteraceae bacterium]|jgi:hypothetical protein
MLLISIGYEQGRTRHQQFRWLYALMLLANHHPVIEEIPASALVTVDTLLVAW